MITETYQTDTSDITIVRDFWDSNTLDLFKNYYVTYAHTNLPDIIQKNSDATGDLETNVGQSHTTTHNPGHNRLSLGMDPLSMCVMKRITDFLSDYLSLEIIPGFAFLGLHLPGSVLTQHTDKPVGEFVVSMPLYTENLSAAWRFTVAGLAIDMHPGDFVIYDGSLPHQRDTPLAPDQFSINLFMLFTHTQSMRDVSEFKHQYQSGDSYLKFIYPGKLIDFITPQTS
jgi:hypothetical protein